MPNLQRLYVRYQTLDMEPVVTSSKYEFSIQPSIFGTTKPVKITATKPKATIDPITSKITYSAEEMAKNRFITLLCFQELPIRGTRIFR